MIHKWLTVLKRPCSNFVVSGNGRIKQTEIMKEYKWRIMAFVDRAFWGLVAIGSLIIYLSFR